MPQVFVGILIICVPFGLSIYSILSVVYPQIRGSWRGSSQPIGKMSAIGIALFFNGCTLFAFAGPFLPVWLVPCWLAIIATGIVLTGLGYLQDKPSNK